MYNCKICNKEFIGIKSKANKYCSIECYRVHQRSGKYSIKEKTVKAYCSHCGNEVFNSFSLTRKGEKSKRLFCNRECYDNFRIKQTIYNKTKICKHCGKEFIGYTKNTKFCSDKCRRELFFNNVSEKYNIKRTSEDGKKYIKDCKICGKEFEINKQKSLTTICSKECISKFYQTDKNRKIKISNAFQGENHPNYVNGCSYNNRVRKTDIKENFSKNDKKSVFKLFNNKCFNCGDTNFLTIDHNIPFSKGGKLTLANSVLLCRSCNCSKNAKMPIEFYTKEKLIKLEKLGITNNSLFFNY